MLRRKGVYKAIRDLQRIHKLYLTNSGYISYRSLNIIEFLF